MTATQKAAAEVYARVRAAGGEVWCEQERRRAPRLFLRATAAALQSGDLLELARRHRDELLSALQSVASCADCRAPSVVLLVVATLAGERRLCLRCANRSELLPPAVEVEIKARRSAS